MRYHSTVLSLAVSLGAAASLHAQAPMQALPSGRASSEVTLLLVDSAARAAAKPSLIKLDYGQPHLRGRKLLTDSLIPYDKPWRTGANAATTLTTDVDLILGGKLVPKGKYVVQTLPSRTGWKLLIQKEADPPPEGDLPYDPKNDFARIDLRQTKLAAPVESLTMWLIPSRTPGQPRGELVIAWGNFSLSTDWSLK